MKVMQINKTSIPPTPSKNQVFVKIKTIFVFLLILFYIPMWLQINMFVSSFGVAKKATTILKDEKIEKVLLIKAKIKIDNIKISESSDLFGMMIGIPGNPQLILSRKLYETFDSDELEYVIMHEAGHYKLAHSIKELLEGLVFFGIGIVVLKKYPNMFLAASLGLVFGILMIQFGKLNEIEADKYSLERVGNPNGMITATEKFREAWKRQDPNNSIIRFLFYRGNPYENRIRMASEEINKR